MPVDLPGYGFAKVPDSVRLQWGPMIEGYLTGRDNLRGVIQLVDVRHGPSPDDRQMNAWLRAMDMPYLLVATKADKISRGQYSRQAKIIRQDLGVEPILFSAQTRQGREQVWKAVFSLCKK